MPVAANDAPRASEPAAAGRSPSSAPATPRPMTRSTAATRATAAVGGAERPTAAARDELGPPALLLGARVAPGEQQAQERDRDGAVRAELERDQAADRVEPARRAAQRDHRGVVVQRRRDLRAVGGGRVQALEARGRREDDEDERDDAAGDEPAVAAGREPGEREGPGELRHRAAAASRGAVRRRAVEVVAVVAQEQLLERRRPARQAAHAELRRAGAAPRRGGSCRRRSARGRPRRGGRGRPASALEPGRRPLGLGDDRRAGEVAQLGQRSGLDRRARRG